MSSNRCNKVIGCLLHYETYKILDIRNKKVGFLYRVIQLVVLAYALFSIIYKKGYQNKDTASSTIRTKVKGIGYINSSRTFAGSSEGKEGFVEVFDAADYVVPPQERNGFFVMTNMLVVGNQSQAKCPENVKFEENWCEDDSDCSPGVVVRNGNGVRTGSCVPSTQGSGERKVCEIYAWCPVPTDDLLSTSPGGGKPAIDAREFTVLVKNQIRFPKFNVIRRNIIARNDSKYLTNCTYDKHTDPRCPIFKLSDIVAACGDDFAQVAYEGATYGIIIEWDCDLDYSEERCIPTYDFRRLDDPHAAIAAGYNFRYAEYFIENGVRHRRLTKAYGLKFEVIVNARAGKFAPEPLFVELGAGVALFSIATVVCDVVLVFCVGKRKVYYEQKYQTIDENNGYTVLDVDIEE